MIKKLYGKNINFLIGSGASFGAIPTLATNYQEEDRNLTIEEILTKKDDSILKSIIYLYFYHKIIKSGFLSDIEKNSVQEEVLKNYEKFIEQLINFMYRENYQKDKRINIFTTNYDLFFEKAVDNLIGKYEFYFNDGSSGNITRRLSMKNYHKRVYHTGNFDNFDREIPIINLFKVHGSVSWKYMYNTFSVDNPIGIEVKYQEESKDYPDNLLEELNKDSLETKVKEIKSVNNEKEKIEVLRKKLRNEFVLIFPEKDKFEKTLYEEYYYQFLRQLSYELERENTILIVFGFSFADEHIAEIVKRACNNPTLKIYIFCYKQDTEKEIKKNLNLDKLPVNVETIMPWDDENINFKVFLDKLFELKSDENE